MSSRELPIALKGVGFAFGPLLANISWVFLAQPVAGFHDLMPRGKFEVSSMLHTRATASVAFLHSPLTCRCLGQSACRRLSLQPSSHFCPNAWRTGSETTPRSNPLEKSSRLGALASLAAAPRTCTPANRRNRKLAAAE
jgi:hypothetical protein